MSIPRWDIITREERHFTAILSAELRGDARPLWNMLRGEFGLDESVTVVDVGFKLCMFRDLIHAGHIERNRDVMDLRKQTFDFVLTLSNQSLVLIEAKAHECFGRKQLDLMRDAQRILLNCPKLVFTMFISQGFAPQSTTRLMSKRGTMTSSFLPGKSWLDSIRKYHLI